ncbi:anti-sigma factor [Amnibacterium kyonggiense]
MTSRENAHLLSGAYALDAVTAEEAALVEAAMRESEDLHGEIVGLSDTAVALGMALPPVSPPPALRARLLDAIGTTPQLGADEDAAPVVAPGVPTTERMPSGGHVPARRRRRMRPVALLAAVTAAVVLFGGGFLLQRSLLEPQGHYAALTVSPDVHEVSARVEGGGTAKVQWSKSQHLTAVVLNGVKTPSDRVLQLWSVKGSTITSAGLYQPQGDEHYMLISGTPSSGSPSPCRSSRTAAPRSRRRGRSSRSRSAPELVAGRSSPDRPSARTRTRPSATARTGWNGQALPQGPCTRTGRAGAPVELRGIGACASARRRPRPDQPKRPET